LGYDVLFLPARFDHLGSGARVRVGRRSFIAHDRFEREKVLSFCLDGEDEGVEEREQDEEGEEGARDGEAVAAASSGPTRTIGWR
jgi:hypothetical protein